MNASVTVTSWSGRVVRERSHSVYVVRFKSTNSALKLIIIFIRNASVEAQSERSSRQRGSLGRTQSKELRYS